MNQLTQRSASPLSGQAMMSASACTYPPAVKASDLLHVDFDQKAIDADGLYLVEIDGHAGVEWRGCRRFARTATGVQMDVRGTGDWQPVEGIRDFNFRVVGRVMQVYRATFATEQQEVSHA